MDHESFDRLARFLGKTGSRRTTLGALLGVGVAGAVAGVDAKGKKKSRGSKKSQGRGNKKSKSNRVSAQAQPGLRDCPVFGPGQNLSECDFKGRDMRGANISGSNASKADFEDADLCGANLARANLGKSDFKNANLTRATLKQANFSGVDSIGATFCETRMPNGQINNADCPGGGGVICCSDFECTPEEPECINGVCDCPTTCCIDSQCPDILFGLLDIPQICDGGDCCVETGEIIGVPNFSGSCNTSTSLPASACCSGTKARAGIVCLCS